MAEEIKNDVPEETADQQNQDEKNNDDGFKPITSQEDLDRIITDRLARKERSVRKEFEGFVKPDDYDALKKTNADLQEKVKAYEADSEKRAIATEYNLDKDLIEFLTGDDKAGWRRQAEKLAGKTRISYPRKNTHEPTGEISLAKALQAELRKE